MSDKCYKAKQVRKALEEGEVVKVFNPGYGGGLINTRWMVDPTISETDKDLQSVVCIGHEKPRQVNLPLSDGQKRRFGIWQTVVQASFHAQMITENTVIEDVFVINGTDFQLQLHEIATGVCIEVLSEDCPVVSTLQTKGKNAVPAYQISSRQTVTSAVCMQ